MDQNSTPPGGSPPERPAGDSASSGNAYGSQQSGYNPPPTQGGGGETPARVEQPGYTQPTYNDASQTTQAFPQQTIFHPQGTPAPNTQPPTYDPQQQQTYGQQQAGYGQQGYGQQGYGQPGAVPPQGQYAPPQGQYAPPQGQYPPPGQYAPQPPGAYPPPGPGYPQQGYAQPAAAPKKSGVPVAVWIIGGILVTLMVACGLVYLFINSLVSNVSTEMGEIGTEFGTLISGASVQAFDSALTLGNYDEAQNMLGGDLARRYSAKVIEQKWEALQEGQGAFSINTNVGQPRQVNGRTVVDWEIEAPSGKSTTVELTLDKAENQFKIIDAKPDLIPEP